MKWTRYTSAGYENECGQRFGAGTNYKCADKRWLITPAPFDGWTLFRETSESYEEVAHFRTLKGAKQYAEALALKESAEACGLTITRSSSPSTP